MAGIRIKQHHVSDCGAACLCSVAAYYRLKLPLARVRQYASTGPEGTNLLGLIHAAERFGFLAKGLKGNIESLSGIPLPAIVHMRLRGGLEHFMVLYKVRRRHLLLMDPADGALHKWLPGDFAACWTGIILLVVPGGSFRRGSGRTSLWMRFFLLLKPHRPVLLEVFFGSLVYTLLGLSTSVFVQKVVDHVLPEGNLKLLNLMGLIMLALLALQALIQHFRTVLVLRCGQRIDAALILGYYRHLFSLPLQFFESMRVGELVSRVNDALKIRIFVSEVMLSSMVNVCVLLFSFGLMFTYYWKLALMILLVVPLYGLIYAGANRLNKRTQRRLMEHGADLESQLVESLGAAGTVKRFGLEAFCASRTEARLTRLLDTAYSSSLTALWADNLSAFLSAAFTIFLLWAGSGLVLDRLLSAGELFSFYTLMGYFTRPVMSLIEMNRSMQDALIAGDRLFDILDLEPESGRIEQGAVAQAQGASPGPGAHMAGLGRTGQDPETMGDICFRGVYFTYGSRRVIFEGLDLCIARGKITAIVGESGSGKSTLLSLLQGLYTPDAGSIRIGSHDVRYLSRESLCRMIGAVPQQIDLFSGTILENIAAGSRKPDLQRVAECCSLLDLWEFIERLPGGLYTLLGENGLQLSGGERQRLAIARALYRDPELLLLDEATASLDARTEEVLRTALLELQAKGKTIVQVAHRLGSVCRADRILVLSGGRLAEEGRHGELLAKKGLYAELWDLQWPEFRF